MALRRTQLIEFACCCGLALITALLSHTSAAAITDTKIQLTRDVLIVSNADGDLDLYLISPEAAPRRLTDNSVDDVGPSWSPDGTWIAYSSTESGNADLYMLNANSGEKRRLTDHPGFDSHPSWSPDGKQLVFVSDRSKRDAVYLIDVESKQVTAISDVNQASQTTPQWSPDGRYIVWHQPIDRNTSQLLIKDLTADTIRALDTGEKANVMQFSWAPNSEHIAFTAEINKNLDIYVTDVPEGKPRRITESEWYDSAAVFSPSGNQLAFVSTRADRLRNSTHVAVANNTLQQHQIGETGREERNPRWIDESTLTVSRFTDLGYRAMVVDINSGHAVPIAPDLGGMQVLSLPRPTVHQSLVSQHP